ncbi:unnamed protein product [Closterium sp. Yama58-4]|nr:unnamed protein product [Closterium sp. Yama58-4]
MPCDPHSPFLSSRNPRGARREESLYAAMRGVGLRRASSASSVTVAPALLLLRLPLATGDFDAFRVALVCGGNGRGSISLALGIAALMILAHVRGAATTLPEYQPTLALTLFPLTPSPFPFPHPHVQLVCRGGRVSRGAYKLSAHFALPSTRHGKRRVYSSSPIPPIPPSLHPPIPMCSTCGSSACVAYKLTVTTPKDTPPSTSHSRSPSYPLLPILSPGPPPCACSTCGSSACVAYKLTVTTPKDTPPSQLSLLAPTNSSATSGGDAAAASPCVQGTFSPPPDPPTSPPPDPPTSPPPDPPTSPPPDPPAGNGNGNGNGPSSSPPPVSAPPSSSPPLPPSSPPPSSAPPSAPPPSSPALEPSPASLAAALASLRTAGDNGGCVGGGASGEGGTGSGGGVAQSWPLIAMEYDEMPSSPGGAQGLAVGEFAKSTITAFDHASAPLPVVTSPQFATNLTDPMPGGAHIRVDKLTASFYRISYTVILVAPDNSPQSAALLLSASGGSKKLNSAITSSNTNGNEVSVNRSDKELTAFVEYAQSGQKGANDEFSLQVTSIGALSTSEATLLWMSRVM